ncbi:MAG: tetratricopeptide repeat protein [Pelagibacterales bacterium]|nr:tetratricopeptide repeat protein [Pelagibacterales bacterium]
MLGKAFSNSLSKNKSQKEENTENKVGFIDNIKTKLENIFHFSNKKIQESKEELIVMKHKFNNLLETNYNLGLTHLENGYLGDAIFRFKFIIKFWPQHYDSHYQLAYCLILKNKFSQAKKVLENLLAKKPDYDQKAYELLKRINDFENHQKGTNE